jgi:CubicO group peptidase (beta-lactamase class C family)
MSMHRMTLLLAFTLASLLQSTASQPAVSPTIQASIASLIQSNEISGAVTLVVRHGQIIHLDAQGLSDVAARRPMRTDDLFWIASMTKPIAGVAILMLQDEGRLSVDDPVEKHLPEFANLWLVEEKSGDRLVLRRPHRAITLKDLLTHTAGVPNLDEPRPHTSLAELVSLTSQQPLSFEPGSQWSYSNSGINTLGRIVEVLSGQRFQDFLNTRLFQPLGMADTTFFPTRSQARRLALAYAKHDGQLVETDVYFVRGDLWDEERTVKPSGGLFSTAEDMARFYQMMLQGGVHEGRRILSEHAVRELTRTHTGEIKTGFTDGMSWGLGFQVVKQPQGVTAALSPGTFGHGGAYATQSWADPKTQTIYILMVQRRGLANGDDSDIRRAFQAAAAQF